MTCRAHEEAVLLHAHGQLQGIRRHWLETHLRACASCRELWARAVLERDALRRALAPAADSEPGAGRLMMAVAVRIRSEAQLEPRGEGSAPNLAAASLAALRRPMRARTVLLVAIALFALAAGAVATVIQRTPDSALVPCWILPGSQYGASHDGKQERNLLSPPRGEFNAPGARPPIGPVPDALPAQAPAFMRFRRPHNK